MASLHVDANKFVGCSDVSVAYHQSSCVLIDSSTEPSTELEQLQMQSRDLDLTANQKPEICTDSLFARETAKISGVERVKHMSM